MTGTAQIGRGNLDGSSPELALITGPTYSGPWLGLLAVDGAHIYYKFGPEIRTGQPGRLGSYRLVRYRSRLSGLAVDGLRASRRARPISANRRERDRAPAPAVDHLSARRPACTITVKAKAALTHRPATTPIGQTTFPVAAGKTLAARFTLTRSGRALKRLRHLDRQ